MDKPYRRLAAGVLLSLSLLNTCRCQPNTLFNQSPFQRQQQTQQLRQQLQQQQQQQQQQRQQQNFPSALNALNPLPPLGSPLSPLSPLSSLSPVVPQNAFRTYNRLNPQNYVPITAYQNEINYDGSFAYGYASADGTTAQAQGYVKNLGLGEDVEAQVVQGSYSYTSPEGTPITVRYIADENGFRAEGAHIPTPPPVPDAIAKSLQYIASAQPYQPVLNPNLNPYQTPFRQYPSAQTLRPGQQLTPLQLQQQQQQRLFQQQQQQPNAAQYQPQYPFNAGAQQQNAFLGGNAAAQFPGAFGLGGDFGTPQQQQQPPNQQNFTQQQQGGQQEQQQQALQQQQQKQQQHQQQQQQQLATQQLRGRPNQLLDPYGYNQYRRYKKATTKT